MTLRSELQMIVNQADAWELHPEMIAGVAAKHPHAITVVAGPVTDQGWQYNCVAYALGAVAREDYAFLGAAIHRLQTTHLKMVAESLKRVASLDEAQLVVYESSGEPLHVGRVRGNRVVSKWGPFHLYEHGLWEVPLSYGDTVSFFRVGPEAEEALAVGCFKAAGVKTAG
jgi:hypothetical protein